MQILVGVKRVIDFSTVIRIKADQTGVETANVKMSMNPFDEIALEEALRLKEKGFASEVLIVSIGDASAQETLRSGLAMGADRAILVETQDNLQILNIAKIFRALVQKENPGLILLGKQAIDDDNNQCGQILAGLLNWPQATFASHIEMQDAKATVTREIDGGLEIIEVNLPAVITSDLRLNQPRFISLPNIVQAKRKPLDKIPLASLGLDLKPHYLVKQVRSPEKRPVGVKVDNVDALVDKLKHEAQIL